MRLWVDLLKDEIQSQTRTHFFFVFSSPDVQALLLSDVLVFLQEKDQKYVFASLVCSHTLVLPFGEHALPAYQLMM